MKKGNDPLGKSVRKERQRFLNIIYFLDSHRTRTLKFSIRTAAISGGLLLVLLSWSFIASGLLLREYKVNSELRHRSRELLTSVFNYQTRYDEVYENAYPNEDLANLAEDDADEIAKSEETEQDETEPENTPSKPRTNLAQDLPSRPSEQLKTAEPTQKGELPILLENFSSNVYDNTLVARFALKNLNSPNKATGTVIATAKFINAAQVVSLINMEVEDGSDEKTEEGSESSSDAHFNIRYYKNKVFRFTQPKGQIGQFTSISFVIKDEQGREKDFNFPINKTAATSSARTELPEESKGPIANAIPEL